MIRPFQMQDLEACADLLIAAYNPPPWSNHWTAETATRYLREFAEAKSFCGFVSCEGDDIVGAMFAHIKTWWTNDELFVDELFVKPEWQGQGHGTALMQAGEEYAKSRALAGLTLLTSKYMPARQFYEHKSYVHAEHVIFMYKEFGQAKPG